MNIKVEYLEEAQSYIDNMPDKARKKLFHNVGLVSMGVKDDRIFKKLTESGIWEFRAAFVLGQDAILAGGGHTRFRQEDAENSKKRNHTCRENQR